MCSNRLLCVVCIQSKSVALVVATHAEELGVSIGGAAAVITEETGMHLNHIWCLERRISEVMGGDVFQPMCTSHSCN